MRSPLPILIVYKKRIGKNRKRKGIEKRDRRDEEG